MINLTKKYFYVATGVILLSANSVANAMQSFGDNRVNTNIKGSTDSADSAIQVLIVNAITFLYLVAVIFALWGGFNILTAGGNDEKVKKGKTIIIQALIGLVVIWLAASLVKWLLVGIFGQTAT